MFWYLNDLAIICRILTLFDVLFAEKQERPEQLRLGVHQGGPSPDPRQPGSGANDQPTGVWRVQLLQPGLRKTGHNIICPLPFQGFVQTLGGEHNIKTYFLSKLKLLLFLWKTLQLAGYLVNLTLWCPIKIRILKIRIRILLNFICLKRHVSAKTVTNK